MARQNQSDARRRELLPVIARTFAELGFRRTTTAALAKRCGVQEPILYRLWPDKKAMFIAAIGYIYDLSTSIWGKLLAETDGRQTTAERLLAYEAEHHGEFGHYRIVFAGLSEVDDPEVHAALTDMYQRYHRFVRKQIESHRDEREVAGGVDAGLAAWAVIGLGTITSIAREFALFDETRRRQLLAFIGRLLLEGRQP